MYITLQIKHILYLLQLANDMMVRFTTPDQIPIRDKDSGGGNEKDSDSKRRISSYDFAIVTEQTRGDKNNITPPNDTQALCSICKRNDKMITDPESGEVICSSCGVVLLDKIEDISRPERRVFGCGAGGIGEGGQTDNTKARTGAPISLARHDMGLATIIGKEDRDASGQKIDTSIRSTVKRLRTWDSRAYIHGSNDRSLIQAFNELDILKDKLALSDAIVEKSAYIYRKAQIRGLVRGRTTSGIMAAAIYAVCREIRTPRTLKDIAAAGNIRRKALAKAYRKLIVELDFKVPNIDPMKCIVKVANKANLSERTKRQAMSIMNDVTNNEIAAGKDPMAIAATVLYISCIKNGENIKQNNISNAAGITGVTLRNRFKKSA